MAPRHRRSAATAAVVPERPPLVPASATAATTRVSTARARAALDANTSDTDGEHVSTMLAPMTRRRTRAAAASSSDMDTDSELAPELPVVTRKTTRARRHATSTPDAAVPEATHGQTRSEPKTQENCTEIDNDPLLSRYLNNELEELRRTFMTRSQTTRMVTTPLGSHDTLWSGLESTPLYITFNKDGGADFSAENADTNDNELAVDAPDLLMKRTVITPDLERHHIAPRLGARKKMDTETADNEEQGPTAGPKWFGMRAPKMTDEVKRDLQLIKMRSVIDPKRFYKKDGKKLPKVFQMGTVVEGATDFYGARLPKRERKARIVDELLADEKSKRYLKRRFVSSQQKLSSAGQSFRAGKKKKTR